MMAGAQLAGANAPAQAGQSLAKGGLITGAGTGTSDSIHTKMGVGGFIIPSAVTAKVGADKLKQMGEANVNVSSGEFHMTPEQIYSVGVQALNHMKDSVLQQGADTGEYWSKDNADFQASNPSVSEEFLRALNPVTGLGSSLGGVHDAVTNGDPTGAVLNSITAAPVLGKVVKPTSKVVDNLIRRVIDSTAKDVTVDHVPKQN